MVSLSIVEPPKERRQEFDRNREKIPLSFEEKLCYTDII